jgi:predicted Rossmann fold flavoprotein
LKTSHLIIIGGGASGIFAALSFAEAKPNSEIIVLEKTGRLLAKVKVSGGGRCNVTHACFDKNIMVQNYPRGEKELRSPFTIFFTHDIIHWFERRGVKLKTEPDGRMFPVTDNSQTIIDCLINETWHAGVTFKMNAVVTLVKKEENIFSVQCSDGSVMTAENLIIAAGGSPHDKNYDWIKSLGINIISPVPSLFTFNIPQNNLKGLEGVVADPCVVSITGSKLKTAGPVLVTHWGISGPAVLKLSAIAARYLYEKNYQFDIELNFLHGKTEDDLRNQFNFMRRDHPTKKILNAKLFELPNRLWERICLLSKVQEQTNFGSLKKEQMNLLLQNLRHFKMDVKGKTTFKEEFVTCGGVELKEINMQTMESKKIKGLYFAGEVMNVDGVTGGFNFQHAWTSGWIAGKHAAINSKS